MGDDITTFWRQLDELRETALAGDVAGANDLIGVLARAGRTGDLTIDAARQDLLDLVAATFGLDHARPPAAVAAPPDLPRGDLGGIAATGQDGVSLVTCCMNREENLIRALASWTACPDIAEIVIVDWSSDRPVRAALDARGIDDPRIRVIRVEGEPRWVLSWAFNIGFRVAACTRILKADADIVLAADFFAQNPLEPGQFIAGNWRTAASDQAHVNGFFYLHKADIAAVAGFNEHITTYGWDDDDLYDRLDRHGLKRQDVAGGTIHHLPHSDEERVGGAAAGRSARAELQRDTMHKIRRNRLLAHIMPYWDGGKVLLPVRVQSGGRGDVVLARAGWLPHPVPAQVEADVDYYALLELTSWRLGPRVFGLNRDRLDLLLARPFAELGRLDVEVALGGQPGALTAPGGYLVLRCGAGGVGAQAAAFDALCRLAAAQGLAVVLRGPFDALPGTDPEAARACAFVPDWEDTGTAVAAELATLRAPAPAGRRCLELAWTPALCAALQPAAPALAPVRDRIFADGQHGLGNRLRAIASAAAIAGATGRELVVVWQPDAHCDCRFDDLFDHDGAVIEQAFADDTASRGCDLYNYMEVEPGARKDALIEPVEGRDLYLRSAYVFNSPLTGWDSENRWLRDLRPVEAVRDMVAGVRHPNDVSAHVRMAGGAAFEHLPYESSAGNWTEDGHQAIAHWRAKSHFSHFLQRIDALADEGRAGRIFLAADMPETYAAFAACYGDRLAMLERAVYDRSASQLRYALADALLLGRAPLLLGSTWSSFSELAMRMAPQDMTIEMSGKDF